MAQRFKTNMNKLKADQGAFDTGGGGEFYKLTDGKHLLRILPPWAEDELFYQKVGYHRPPGRENVSTKVVCPDYTFGKKGTCPICKARGRVYKQLGKEAAKDYNFQKRAYLNVLNMRKNEDGSVDNTVYVLEAPATVMNPILNFMAEENSDQLIDPNEGYNILLVRKKDKGFTKYEVMIKPGVVDLAAKGFDVDEVLEGLHDLGRKVTEPDADDFSEVLDALNAATFDDGDGPQMDDDAADPDDDPTPRKLKSQKVSNGSKALANDDDDDDAPPAKAPVKKKAAPVVQDDDDADDDDDAPPPPVKKKQAPAPVADDDDDDDAPPPPKKKTLPAKTKPAPVDDDDDDAPPPPKKKAAVIADDDDEDGLDDVEDFGEPEFDSDEEIPF